MNNDDLLKLLKKGTLTDIDEAGDYYFYNVQREFRYLTPLTKEVLLLVAERFNLNIKKKGGHPDVKFAVSSAVRPVSYNREISRNNLNVSLQSTHSYGTSFDIFFDEFYVVLPEYDYLSDEARRTLGFLLGGYLRRQFHAVLFETLIELQEEGVLYAILERSQRCYHVTAVKR